MINRLGRIAAVAAWSVSVWSLLTPADSWFVQVCRYLFWALLVVHGSECVYLYTLLRRARKPVLAPLALTLLFGVFHLGPVQAQLKAERGI